jgi:hypothetical protein
MKSSRRDHIGRSFYNRARLSGAEDSAARRVIGLGPTRGESMPKLTAVSRTVAEESPKSAAASYLELSTVEQINGSVSKVGDTSKCAC